VSPYLYGRFGGDRATTGTYRRSSASTSYGSGGAGGGGYTGGAGSSTGGIGGGDGGSFNGGTNQSNPAAARAGAGPVTINWVGR
jgi:hypothetical protein